MKWIEEREMEGREEKDRGRGRKRKQNVGWERPAHSCEIGRHKAVIKEGEGENAILSLSCL